MRRRGECVCFQSFQTKVFEDNSVARLKQIEDAKRPFDESLIVRRQQENVKEILFGKLQRISKIFVRGGLTREFFICFLPSLKRRTIKVSNLFSVHFLAAVSLQSFLSFLVTLVGDFVSVIGKKRLSGSRFLSSEVCLQSFLKIISSDLHINQLTSSTALRRKSHRFQT